MNYGTWWNIIKMKGKKERIKTLGFENWDLILSLSYFIEEC
jgi:hypothetical protein